MIASVLLTLFAVVVAIVLYASTRPDTFEVSRSAIIETPQDRLFGIVSDLGNFDAWSPWSRLDAGMKMTLGATTTGVGATYAWDGNNAVGAGRMEIVGTTPDSLVQIRLDFFRPFKATNNVTFRLEPVAEGTRMTWGMDGPVPLPAKVLHLFMNMDNMVGGQFEEGLANLKALAETEPGGDLPGIVV